MKKKAKRYAEGGEPKFERSTYERARAMLRDNPATADELTPSLDDRIARAREMIQGVRQSMPEPAPSRPASRPAVSQDRPAVSQDRPAYPTARRVAEESSDTEDADMGRAMQSAAAERGRDFVRDADISVPPSASRGLAASSAPRSAPRSAPTTPALETEARRTVRGLVPNTPFEDANRARLARIEEEKEQIAAVRKAAQQDMLERDMPPRGLQSQLAIRQAQQREEKGSIYSPDFGRPRDEREQRQSLRDLAKGLERTDADVQAAKKRADAAAARRAAASAASRDIEDYEVGQAARAAMRSSRRAEVESNRAREEAEEGAARKRQRVSAATPPVPAPGTRAFANASERAQQRSDRQAESRAQADAEARGRESDTRERERQAQEERDRRMAETRRRQAESRAQAEAEARGRESDTRERARQAQEERDRKRQRVSAATPPVPAPGTRAFANASERAQRRSERQNERNLADEVKRIARQEMLERRRTPIEAAALRRRNDESSPRFKSGGMVGSASKRADGIATKGKTRGKYL